MHKYNKQENTPPSFPGFVDSIAGRSSERFARLGKYEKPKERAVPSQNSDECETAVFVVREMIKLARASGWGANWRGWGGGEVTASLSMRFVRVFVRRTDNYPSIQFQLHWHPLLWDC